VTASQDSIKTSGIVLDAQLEKEDQPTKDNANQLDNVQELFNTMVSGTPNHAVPVDTAHKDQDTSSEPTDLDVTESERPVTASQDSTRMFGIVSDAQLDKEELVTKELANPLLHVPETFNTTVSGTPNHAVPVDIAHKDQDTSLDQTDQVATESERPVTASQDSTRTFGIVSDVLVEKEDQPTKEHAKLPLHVLDHSNTMVSGTPNHAVPVDIAHKDQDTSSEPTDPDVIELESHAIAYLNSMRTHGNASDAHMDKEDQETRELAKLLHHVLDHSNTTVSGTPNHAVPVDIAHKDQDTSLDQTDQDVTDQDKDAHVPKPSMRTHGHAENAQEDNSEAPGTIIITIIIMMDQLPTSIHAITHHNVTQLPHSSDQEKLATPVLCAHLDTDQTQFKENVDSSQLADVPTESQKMDGHASHAQTDTSHQPIEDNVSQLLALNQTPSLETPLPATDVFHAKLDGSQMPCRENALESDQSAHALKSITHKTNTNVLNAQLIKLLMPVTLNVLMPHVPKITTILVHQLIAMHAESAQVDSTQTHKEEPVIDSSPLLVPVDKSSLLTVTTVSIAQ